MNLDEINNKKCIDPFKESNFKKNKIDFHWVDTEQYHHFRKIKILKKHPEIRNLFGTDIITLPYMLTYCFTMFMITYWIRNQSLFMFLVIGYLFGALFTHSLQTGSHELSHNLCFKRPYLNKILAIFANFPTGFPSAILFQKYHADHHIFQSVEVLDPDVPTLMELKIFNSCFFKILWLFLLPIFYSFRPMIINPKKVGLWEVINFVSVVFFDFLVYKYLGAYCLFFMFYSTLMGLSLHPVAGNLIAEHYEFVYKFETYSYYGICNILNFNVGYHNEHHDFPRIPWRRLPELSKIAPEFYNHLPCYSSYLKVMYHFISNKNMGVFSRIKRKRNK